MHDRPAASMVEVNFPLSMPPTLASNKYSLNYHLPRLPHTRHVAQLETEKRSKEEHSWGQVFKASAVDHGLRTPPKEMTSTNVNPLMAQHVGGLPYTSVPAARPAVASYSTSLGTVASTKYHSKAPPSHDSYRSAARPQSPVFQRDNHVRGHRGRNSVDNTTIASYLQIPSSINDSKGSLAEFAAQITCLFWFESSFNLHRVEESKTAPMPATPLVPEAIPTLGFRKWVTTILSTTQVTQNVILLALMFIYRLKRLNPGVKGKLGSEYRLLTVALMLGNKFLDDNTYTNKTWAEVSGITVQEIHIMEVEFLSNMRYTLYASEAEWKAWHVKLGKFWNYFDMASKNPPEEAPKAVNLPTPIFNHRPDLPSPPASTQTSPPFTNHIGNQPYAHPLYFPPSISPSTQLLEVDFKNFGRKRSHDDPSQEQPSKRVSLSQSAASTCTLTPATIQGITPTIPRLPMPNVSIPANNSYGAYQGSSPAQLSMPSRSMSTAFPGPSRWPQNGMLPSLQPSSYFSGASISPMNEWPSRRSPFPPGSATPSPTSNVFPQSYQTPNQPSPSGYPTSRSSPYKPVRSVNTLLVPPPSASMHDPPQHLGFDQMHYQPLGKPMSERRAGVLPYMYHDNWSQSQPQSQQMSNVLPHPNFS